MPNKSVAVFDSNDVFVAEVVAKHDKPSLVDVNSALITTAPELLEACRKLLGAMQTAKNIGSVNHLDAADDGGAFWYDSIESAKVAITKATT